MKLTLKKNKRNKKRDKEKSKINNRKTQKKKYTKKLLKHTGGVPHKNYRKYAKQQPTPRLNDVEKLEKEVREQERKKAQKKKKKEAKKVKQPNTMLTSQSAILPPPASKMQKFRTALINTTKKAALATLNTTKKIKEKTKAAASSTFDTAKSAASSTLDAAKSAASSTLDAAKSAASSTLDAASSTFDAAKSAALAKAININSLMTKTLKSLSKNTSKKEGEIELKGLKDVVVTQLNPTIEQLTKEAEEELTQDNNQSINKRTLLMQVIKYGNTILHQLSTTSKPSFPKTNFKMTEMGDSVTSQVVPKASVETINLTNRDSESPGCTGTNCPIPENSEVVLTKPTPSSLETPVGTTNQQSKVSEFSGCTGMDCPIPDNSEITPTISTTPSPEATVESINLTTRDSESPGCTGRNCPIPENSKVISIISTPSSPQASMKTSTLNDTQVWTIDLQSNLNSLLSSLNTLRTKFNINFGVTAQLGSIYNSLPTFLSIQRKIQQLFSLKISQDCKDYVLHYIVINKNGNWDFSPELKYFFENIPNTNYIPAYPLQLLNDTLPENINCNKIIIIYKDLIDLIISQSKIIQSKQQQSKIEPPGLEVDLGSVACGTATSISKASSGYSPSPSLQQLSPSLRSPQLQSQVTVSRVSPLSRPPSPSEASTASSLPSSPQQLSPQSRSPPPSETIGGAPPNPYTNIIKEIKNFQQKLKSLAGISISTNESKNLFQGLEIKEYEYSQGQKGQQSSGLSANDRKLLQDILDNYNNIKGIDADIKNSIQSIPGQVEQLVLQKLTMNELARQQLEDRIRKQIEDQDNQEKASTLKQLQQENKNLEMVLEKYRQYGYIGINPADDDDLITFVNPDDDEEVPKEGTPKSLVMGMYNSKEEDPQKYNFYRHKFIENQASALPDVLLLPATLAVNNQSYQSLSGNIHIVAPLNNLLQKEAFTQDGNIKVDELNQFGGTGDELSSSEIIGTTCAATQAADEDATQSIPTIQEPEKYDDKYFILPQSGPIKSPTMPIYINNVFNILNLISPQLNIGEYEKASSMFLDFLLSLYGFTHIELWENSIDNQIINSIFFSQPNNFVPNTLTPGFIMVYQKNDKPKYVTLTNDCYQTKGINTNAGQSFSNKNNLKFRLVPSDPDDATKPWTNSYIDLNSIQLTDFQDKNSFINFIIKKSNYAFDISNIDSVFLIYNPNLNTQLNFINLYKNNKLFSEEKLNEIQTSHDNQEIVEKERMETEAQQEKQRLEDEKEKMEIEAQQEKERMEAKAEKEANIQNLTEEINKLKEKLATIKSEKNNIDISLSVVSKKIKTIGDSLEEIEINIQSKNDELETYKSKDSGNELYKSTNKEKTELVINKRRELDKQNELQTLKDNLTLEQQKLSNEETSMQDELQSKQKELQTLQKQQTPPSVGGKHKKIKNKKSKKKTKKNNEEIIDIKKFFSPKAKYKSKNNKQNKSKKIKVRPTTQKKSGGGKNMQIVKPQVTITDAIKSLLLNKNLDGNKWLLNIPEINKLLKKKPNNKPVTRCAAAEAANIEAANPDVSNPEPIATCRAAKAAHTHATI